LVNYILENNVVMQALIDAIDYASDADWEDFIRRINPTYPVDRPRIRV